MGVVWFKTTHYLRRNRVKSLHLVCPFTALEYGDIVKTSIPNWSFKRNEMDAEFNNFSLSITTSFCIPNEIINTVKGPRMCSTARKGMTLTIAYLESLSMVVSTNFFSVVKISMCTICHGNSGLGGCRSYLCSLQTEQSPARLTGIDWGWHAHEYSDSVVS